MAKSLSILYIASEVEPFAKTGGLADVAGAFPQVIREMDHDIRILLPKYGFIGDRKYNIYDVIRLRDIPVPIGKRTEKANIKSSFITNQRIKVQVYFFDLPVFFNRKGIYQDPAAKKDYPDNDDRFISFSRGALETLKRLGWKPDIIHCNDWQTALIPAYLKTIYKSDPFFAKMKSIFTIHNLAYQGVFPKSSFEKTGLPADLLNESTGILTGDVINFMKAGLQFADALTTVSERYAEEISTDHDLGCGFRDLLKKRRKELHGILNGADYSVWDPAVDKHIPQQYSIKTINEKTENKNALLKSFKLPMKNDTPVIGFISRLVDQKGLDLIEEIAESLLKKDVKLIILGSGEKRYHSLLTELASKFPDKVGVKLAYDNELSHLIEAGSDMFLMPSRYEPCGLNQIYSMRYGTIPIVRATGGLDDTVVDVNGASPAGTGFKFEPYEGKILLQTIDRALKVYKDKKLWNRIIKNAMEQDFSWERSAKQYVSLYRKILKK
jgi:starch synthase